MIRSRAWAVVGAAALGLHARGLAAQDGVEYVRTFLLVEASYVQDRHDLQGVVAVVGRGAGRGAGPSQEFGLRTEYGLAPWLQVSVSGEVESGARGVSGPWLGLASGLWRQMGRLALTVRAEWRPASAAHRGAGELGLVAARALGPGQLHVGLLRQAEGGIRPQGLVGAAFILRASARWHPLLELVAPWDGEEAVTVLAGVVAHVGAGFQVGLGFPVPVRARPGLALVVTQEVSLAPRLGGGRDER